MQRRGVLFKSGPSLPQIISRDSQRYRQAGQQRRALTNSTSRLSVPRPVSYGVSGRGEIKCFDQAVAPAVNTSPYGLQGPTDATSAEPGTAFVGITCLNEIQQGATSYNRIGTKILMKSIQLRCVLSVAGSNTTSAQGTARVCLVYDRQPNGAYPTLSTIFSSNVSGTPAFNCGVNMSNRDRFVILRNKFIPLFIGASSIYHLDEYVKTRLETQYRTTTGAIGDITTGALYLVAFAASSGTATSFVPFSSVNARIRYYD